MTMLNFLRWPRQNTSADTAKERLQILLSHERVDRSGPDYLPMLQRDILEVIKKYMRVERDDVDIKLERGVDLSTLEINVELPGARTLQAGAA
jgi:cell division topological specificity factor